MKRGKASDEKRREKVDNRRKSDERREKSENEFSVTMGCRHDLQAIDWSFPPQAKLV